MRRSVHSSLRPAALLIPCACCTPLASVITAPSRPSPHRTASPATPDTQDSPHGQPPAPSPCRMRPEKRPHAAHHHPLIRQQATGRKRPATCQQSLRSSHAGRSKARFAEGSIGERPKPPLSCPGRKGPVILLGLRSPKAAPPSSGQLCQVIVGASPKPLKKAFSGCSGACSGPLPVG